jgi:hypothetical protein
MLGSISPIPDLKKSPNNLLECIIPVCDVSNGINARFHHMYRSDVVYLRLNLEAGCGIN